MCSITKLMSCPKSFITQLIKLKAGDGFSSLCLSSTLTLSIMVYVNYASLHGHGKVNDYQTHIIATLPHGPLNIG